MLLAQQLADAPHPPGHQSLLNMLARAGGYRKIQIPGLAALRNGVTREEIREVFLQVGIYAGVPAAIDSFRIAREVFESIDKKA